MQSVELILNMNSNGCLKSYFSHFLVFSFSDAAPSHISCWTVTSCLFICWPVWWHTGLSYAHVWPLTSMIAQLIPHHQHFMLLNVKVLLVSKSVCCMSHHTLCLAVRYSELNLSDALCHSVIMPVCRNWARQCLSPMEVITLKLRESRQICSAQISHTVQSSGDRNVKLQMFPDYRLVQ